MKIFVIGSKHQYHLMPPILEELERLGHEPTTPNSYDDPMLEERLKADPKEHAEFKRKMLRLQEEKVRANDAVLACNYAKGDVADYIGGATLIEIFQAFQQEKQIYLMNPIPRGIFADELVGMGPVILYGDLSKIQ